MVTGAAYQPDGNVGSGALAVVTGAVRSISRPLTVPVVWLPALSATLADADRLSPSPMTMLSAGQVPSMPDSASEQVQCTVTLPLYQPLLVGALVGAPDRVGGVLSTLMPLTVALWSLPARSSATPVTDWLAPSLRI